MEGKPTCESPARERLLIVDGHSYAYRAFFAIRALSSPEGYATNAIYGFIRTLGKVRERVKPTRILVVWDGGLAEERMTLLPDYKAQRAEMPSDLEAQLDHIVAYLGAAGICSYMKEHCEADDCIAAITRQAVEADWDVVIASSDKDFMQLVSPRVHLLNPHDRHETLWGAEEVRAKTGVEPGQIVDWLSLTGDAVDNIAGVRGVGPKTAAELLRQFGSIDELYGRLGEVRSERVREQLAAEEATVRRNRNLVRLNSEVACAVSLRETCVRHWNEEELRRLYSSWGFKTLLRELEEQVAQKADFFDAKAGVP